MFQVGNFPLFVAVAVLVGEMANDCPRKHKTTANTAPHPWHCHGRHGRFFAVDGDCPLAGGVAAGAAPVGEDHPAEVRSGNVVVGEDVVQDRLGKCSLINWCYTFVGKARRFGAAFNGQVFNRARYAFVVKLRRRD